MTTENAAAVSFAAKQPHTDVTGYSRTEDIRVTTRRREETSKLALLVTA